MDSENKLEYQPVSPDMFQQQMMGSFCSLINGHLMLAETFSDTSQAIKTSIAELIKTVEETRQEICNEMRELKAAIKQNFSNNDKPGPGTIAGNNEIIKPNKTVNVIVPPVVQGMLDKLEAVTSKLSKFKTLSTVKNDISNVTLEKSIVSSTDNANNSYVHKQSENGGVYTNEARSSRQTSDLASTENGSPSKSQAIVIKREREESQSSEDKSDRNSQSDDSNSSDNDNDFNHFKRKPRAKRLAAIIGRVNTQSTISHSSDKESEFNDGYLKISKPAAPKNRGRGRRGRRGRKGKI